MTWTFSVRTQTDPETLRIVRRMVRDIVEGEGGSEDDAWSLELALGEALFNAHCHAYPDAAGPIEVSVSFDEGTFTVTVRDRGEPVSVPQVPSDLPADRKRLGLFLMSAVVDRLDVSQNEDETGRGLSVTMVKRLQSGNGPMSETAQ